MILEEKFNCFDDKNMPYTFDTEQNSAFAHRHVRVEDKSFYISCGGNKYIMKTPTLYDFEMDVTVSFHNVGNRAELLSYIHYNKITREGYMLKVRLGGGSPNDVNVSISAVDGADEAVLYSKAAVLPEAFGQGKTYDQKIKVEGSNISVLFNGMSFDFSLSDNIYACGSVGIGFGYCVGEMQVHGLKVKDDTEPDAVLLENTVSIPLRNGGNIPYRLSYRIIKAGEDQYLEYSFEGGATEREKTPEYPRATGQYCVEQTRFWSPYIKIYDSDYDLAQKQYIANGMIATTDPGLHWKNILSSYYGVVDLPLKGIMALEDACRIDSFNIVFGYEKMESEGYKMQTEENVEFIFDGNTGKLVYEGTARDKEFISVTSPEDKNALKLVGDEIVDREAVLKHLKGNHYFDETEDIVFGVHINTDRDCGSLWLCAGLFDVYGCFIDEDFIEEGRGYDYICRHDPLPVGVYRAHFNLCCGDDRSLASKEIVFEVYDSKGKLSAPLASGLPFLFSMPNEQRYLDRDAFDMRNPMPGCDMEHFYSCTAFTGDIAGKYRPWEMDKRFGRTWYVWLNSNKADHRTMLVDEGERYGDIILKNADYTYYPVKYEWGVMRHDPWKTFAFPSGLMNYLRDFVELHPEYKLDIDLNKNTVTENELDRLLNTARGEWIDYVNKRTLEAIREDNIELKRKYPSFKRACYGPCPIYVIPMAMHNTIRYYGYVPDESLAKDVFDGFCQLEDYPYSCAYHTYRGAFFVMNMLLHSPGLKIYPEQYTSSYGGCIDGAVKDATPPLGKYDVPRYFNTTLAFEYAFNTAHLQDGEFKYWNSYGFMQRDFTPDFVDEFVRSWKCVKDNKPKRPLRSAAFLSEISVKDDRYERYGGKQYIYNKSEVGLGYVYQTMRHKGLPVGFALKWDGLKDISRDDTDVLVLPSLEGAPEEALREIRRLSNEGVALVAVSNVGGLCDIFGVTKNIQNVKINTLKFNAKTELILPFESAFEYSANGAETVLEAYDINGSSAPVMLKHGKNILINASVTDIGRSTFDSASPYPESISVLLREALGMALENAYEPIVKGENCGVTVFETENGDTLLLVTDYSEYGVKRSGKPARIIFNTDEWNDALPIYNSGYNFKQNGVLKQIELELGYEESALFELRRK